MEADAAEETARSRGEIRRAVHLMDNDLVHIYSSGQPYKAELVRQMLSDHNIQSFIVNKQDSAYKFGEIEFLYTVTM